MNRSIYFLKYFEDVVDELSEVTEVTGHQTATIGSVCVSVPEDIATKLQPNVGKRVKLLRAEHDFRLRVLG